MCFLEIFKGVTDEKGNFKGHFHEFIIGMLNLYEASYHSVEEESILDDAREFTTKYLKENLEKISDENITSLVRHSLDFPLHWMLPRVETTWFIEVYEKRSGMNPAVLELAKLDFNMVQAIYQQDMKNASRYMGFTFTFSANNRIIYELSFTAIGRKKTVL